MGLKVRVQEIGVDLACYSTSDWLDEERDW